MKKRLLSGLPMAAFVLISAFYFPAWVTLLILLAVTVVTQLEFYRLLDAAGIPSFRIVGVLAGLLLFMAAIADHVSPQLLSFEILALFTIVFVVCIRMFPQKNNPMPLQTIGCTIFGVLYVPFLVGFLARIIFYDTTTMNAPLTATGRLLALYLITVVKMTDTGALIVGKLIGRHKMVPRISPGKTWEGTLGGIVIGTLSGMLFIRLAATPGPGDAWFMGTIPFTFTDMLVLGLLLSIISVPGDLVESLLKRAAGVKDSGALLPGIGGLLDVMDSLLLTAPVMYYYLFIVKVFGALYNPAC
jgi:phosphatidate cytidylyltransferase